MSKQQLLFNDKPIEVKDIEPLFTLFPEECFNQLIKRGMNKGHALWKVIEPNLCLDWVELWNEYEDKGVMTYLKLKINNQWFRINEYDDSTVKFNHKEIYSWTETDVFDKKTAAKIKEKIKSFIFKNQYQFDV